MEKLAPTLQRMEVTRLAHLPGVYQVALNRPAKYNALDEVMWHEIPLIFQCLSEETDCRCIILSGHGKHFSTGIDLEFAANGVNSSRFSTQGIAEIDVARKAAAFQKLISFLQDSVASIGRCRKPVIAMIHGFCLGGGFAIASSCDIRLASNDAIFSVKEVDIGISADLGTLQWLPKIVGNDGWELSGCNFSSNRLLKVREICYTARMISAEEAAGVGFLSSVEMDRDHLKGKVENLALEIAQKSPVAIDGTKYFLNYGRDHNTRDSMNAQVIWNSAMLQTEDVAVAFQRRLNKSTSEPKFSKL